MLAAFKQALEDNRVDVADALLSALETLDRNPDDGSVLREAYAAIAGYPEPRGRRKQAH
jgi:phage terminase large subunit-like protein